MLPLIPGENITRAALTLPDAISAPDEPHYVEIRLRGRRILITFNRIEYKAAGNKTKAHWSWTASSAALVK
jgi:hypothetical protein